MYVALGEIGAGIVVGVLVFTAILVRMVIARSDLVTPQAFKDEREEIGHTGGGFGLDLAWPWYFKKQVFSDARFVNQTRNYLTGWMWSLLRGEPLNGSTWQVLLVISSRLLFIVIATAIAVMAVGNVLFLAIVYLLLSLAWPVFVVTVVILRATESAWSKLRTTSASCPACFYVGARPAYKCAGCSRLHRDLRPGQLGVFERRCGCGELMPTMTLRAAWSEVAVCQRCEEPLRRGAAAVRDIRIPIFGDVSAGKTRFLYASLESMRDLSSRRSVSLSFPDLESQQRADIALSTIQHSRDTAKTDTTRPRALSFRLGDGSRSTLIHMFDAAGELYRNADDYDQVAYLDAGHGLIYVVDPIALSPIRSEVAGYPAAADHIAAAENRDPEQAYNQVVTRLRGGGVKAKSQRLAIVISKADVLRSCGIRLPTRSPAIASWLMENGLHNVVLAAPNEFAAVSFFTVASIAAGANEPATDAGAPVRWLLRVQGVRLPAEAEQNAPAPTGAPA